MAEQKAKAVGDRCPCCGRVVQAEGDMDFMALLRANDVRKVFTITPDRQFVWSDALGMQEGAQAFADAVNAALASSGAPVAGGGDLNK